MKTRMVMGQASWRVATREVEAFLTVTGGHLGPITFRLGGRRISPFSVAPWWGEKLESSSPPILRVLRGDFFCMPFGGNATPYRGERHPIHGEVANAKWKWEAAASGRLHVSLRTKVRRGRVDKYIELRPGQTAVYQRHVISGMTGRMNLGHHAMLKFRSPGVISTSRFVFGQVFPERFEQPAQGGYSLLKPGAQFSTLARVPTVTGEWADLSRYPARRGFEDLVTLVADERLAWAWTAVTFPQERFVWFALKDPRVLRETVLWISNGGRYYAPWNGRHVDVMGLEEVTSYFHGGLAESARPNPFLQRGFPTCLTLRSQPPTVVNYIMAVAAIPRGFDRVVAIERTEKGVTLRAANGQQVRAAVDVAFLAERGAERA